MVREFVNMLIQKGNRHLYHRVVCLLDSLSICLTQQANDGFLVRKDRNTLLRYEDGCGMYGRYLNLVFNDFAYIA